MTVRQREVRNTLVGWFVLAVILTGPLVFILAWELLKLLAAW